VLSTSRLAGIVDHEPADLVCVVRAGTPLGFVQDTLAAAPGFRHDETALKGSLLTVGGVDLRVRGPITRCVTITYAPDGNSIQPDVLRYLARQRNAWMGVYCDVLVPGSLAVGDTLYVRPASP